MRLGDTTEHVVLVSMMFTMFLPITTHRVFRMQREEPFVSVTEHLADVPNRRSE